MEMIRSGYIIVGNYYRHSINKLDETSGNEVQLNSDICYNEKTNMTLNICKNHPITKYVEHNYVGQSYQIDELF